MKLEEKIMRTLASFATIATEDLANKMAWRAEAEAQVAQAKQRINNAKTAAEIEEAGDARQSAQADVDYRESWVKYAEGYQNAVKLITRWIQKDIDEYHREEDEETESEEVLEVSVQDEALSA